MFINPRKMRMVSFAMSIEEPIKGVMKELYVATIKANPLINRLKPLPQVVVP